MLRIALLFWILLPGSGSVVAASPDELTLEEIRDVKALIGIVEQWSDEVVREFGRSMIEILMKEATAPPMGGPR
jgi:hypothetical protein